MFLGDTIDRRRRSGIHRVAVETARALSSLTTLDLVRWDFGEGRLRFLDAYELDIVFGKGAWPAGIKARLDCRSVGRPFRELLEDPENTWLLTPEVWHEKSGVDALARAVSHCRDWGGRFASVFYDLIPMTNPHYMGGAADHEAYLSEILRTDLVLPISHYCGGDLATLWRERGLQRIPVIHPLPLPDAGFVSVDRERGAAAKRSKRIVMLGTVEPRKRQVQFVEAMAKARKRSPAVAGWELEIIGSLHPNSADAFTPQLAAYDWLTHHDYLEDGEIKKLLQDCGFSAFVSDDEGYGLPIAESLALGAPCLCADFGSMAEIAADGGCLAVDVRDEAALEEAIVRLCETPALLADLRQQIAARRFRDWTDYARGVVGAMAAHDRGADAAPIGLRVEQAPLLRPGDTLDRKAFETLATADIVRLPDETSRESFIAEARRQAWPALLPTPVLAEEGDAPLARLQGERGVRRDLSLIEQSYARNRAAIDPAFKNRPVFLRILISTFNRREFVTRNARWLLDTVMPADDGSIELMIVDGASEDQTMDMLLRLHDSRLRLDESAAGIGMLGGIRDAAHAPGAEYIWVVGDDDYLVPGQLPKIVKALKANPGIPFAFTNFCVYHRQALGSADTPERLIAEALPIAQGVAPSGVMKVRQAAEQTDNLFTAIYSIVWRADLLSTAFEHSFTGEPFADMTQAIPCTEFVLRRYAECDAYWHAEPAIAGNAHNNWRRHRPRWHGAVMPMAFALAREVGVDPKLLQTWADMHMNLLREALEIAREDGSDPRLRAQDDALAQAVFRQPLPTAAP